MNIRKRVGQRLRRLRLAMNYSQKAVATDLGLATSTISHWERGSRAVDIDVIHRLASYFGIKPHELLCDERVER